MQRRCKPLWQQGFGWARIRAIPSTTSKGRTSGSSSAQGWAQLASLDPDSEEGPQSWPCVQPTRTPAPVPVPLLNVAAACPSPGYVNMPTTGSSGLVGAMPCSGSPTVHDTSSHMHIHSSGGSVAFIMAVVRRSTVLRGVFKAPSTSVLRLSLRS